MLVGGRGSATERYSAPDLQHRDAVEVKPWLYQEWDSLPETWDWQMIAKARKKRHWMVRSVHILHRRTFVHAYTITEKRPVR